jgi:ABC-type Na+ efflux pump permease subunit
MPKIPQEYFVAGVILNLLLYGLFCYSLYRAIKQVKPKNQKISPSYIWLLMIPVVQWGANFFVIPRLADSLQAELEERNFEISERPTYNQGIAYAAASAVTSLVALVFPAGGLLGIAALVLMIQYWVKANWYRKVLEKDSLENLPD